MTFPCCHVSRWSSELRELTDRDAARARARGLPRDTDQVDNSVEAVLRKTDWSTCPAGEERKIQIIVSLLADVNDPGNTLIVHDNGSGIEGRTHPSLPLRLAFFTPPRLPTVSHTLPYWPCYWCAGLLAAPRTDMRTFAKLSYSHEFRPTSSSAPTSSSGRHGNIGKFGMGARPCSSRPPSPLSPVPGQPSLGTTQPPGLAPLPITPPNRLPQARNPQAST